MKNTNKKGFTLVELVIVIAVIAILAAVLIPTFTSVINRANQSAALQKAKAEFDELWVDFVADEHEVPTWITVTAGVVTLHNNKNTFTAGEAPANYTAALDATAVLVENGTKVKIADAPDGYAVAVQFTENGYEVVLVKVTSLLFTEATGKELTAE